MSDTCKQASEAPAVNLNPVASVVSHAMHRNEQGRLVIACKIEAVRPEDLAFGTNLFTNTQVTEFQRNAVREALEVEAGHVAGEFQAMRDKLDAVYFERNQLAIALARMVLIRQSDEELGKAPAAGYGFDPMTGRAVVYVTLPMGDQVSWHMDDKTTEYLKGWGPKPLPRFEGEWDGTFKAREMGWPNLYVRTQKPFCEQAMVATRFSDKPEGATHYRVCAGGKDRYYRQHPTDGEWLYYHANDSLWHPTDLSDDYLESHIFRIAGDTQDDPYAYDTEQPAVTQISNMIAPARSVDEPHGPTLEYLAALITKYPYQAKGA